MQQPEWEEVKKVFTAALDQPAAQRAQFLADTCGADKALRVEVDSLLAAHEEPKNLLEKHALDLAAQLQTERHSYVGKRFGPYRILREIGRGGMGAVFLGERADGDFQQQVALKIIRQSFVDGELERHFRRERQILASLNHPHIAKLIDGGISETGELFLAMEFIEGAPLLAFAAHQDLTIEDRLRLFLKICNAVSFAHQNLVIHRDLKPSNILVTADGVPKLLDFGLAKLSEQPAAGSSAEGGADQTQTGFRAFTPAYASPEQILGKSVTTSSDVFSLGVILFELLTGEKPFHFEGKSLDEIIRTVTTGEPSLPSRLGKSENPQSATRQRQLRGDLDNITLKALQKDSARRYQSVAEFGNDIERHLERLPVTARPNTLWYRASRFYQRNKIAVSAAALVIIALVAGLAIALRQYGNARRETAKARLENARAEQLNNFLQTILSSAAPVEKGKDAKVIDVIDDAAERIDTEFPGQPELRAQALLSVGNTYRTLGLTDKAERTLREALKLNTELYGEENAATAMNQIYLSDPVLAKGRTAEAESLLTKGIETERRLLPTRNKDLAFGLRALGALYANRGEYDKAKAVLQESVLMYDEIFGKDNPDSAIALVITGRAKEFSGDLAGAESIYRQSIEIFRPLPKRYENRLALALYNLGNLLITRGKFDEALGVIREGEAIYQKSGGTTIYAFWGKFYLTRAYFLMGDYQRALAEGLSSLDIGRKIHIEQSSDYIVQLTNVGLALTRSGKAREGEPYLRQSVELARVHLAPGDVTTPAMESALGECLTAQKKFAEAEPLLVQSLEKINAILGEKSRPAGLAAKRLVELYEKMNKPELAAKYRPLVPAKL